MLKKSGCGRLKTPDEVVRVLLLGQHHCQQKRAGVVIGAVAVLESRDGENRMLKNPSRITHTLEVIQSHNWQKTLSAFSIVVCRRDAFGFLILMQNQGLVGEGGEIYQYFY